MKHIHKKKKTKSFAIVPKQRKIETVAKEGEGIRILENSSKLCISLFHVSRPLVPDTVSTRCNHAFTYPRSSNKISGRRRDGLTEKRVHPRRRRRRGSGGILDERRRPLAFPLLGQCPRASRVVSSTTTRSVCAPLLAEFLERATPTTRHVLADEIRKKARGSAGCVCFHLDPHTMCTRKDPTTRVPATFAIVYRATTVPQSCGGGCGGGNGDRLCELTRILHPETANEH